MAMTEFSLTSTTSNLKCRETGKKKKKKKREWKLYGRKIVQSNMFMCVCVCLLSSDQFFKRFDNHYDFVDDRQDRQQVR